MISVRKMYKANHEPGRMRKDLPGIEKAFLCVQQVQRYQAQDPVLLEVSRLSSFADYFIVCSGRSSRQVQSIAENLEMILEEHGIRPLGVEGRHGRVIGCSWTTVTSSSMSSTSRFVAL